MAGFGSIHTGPPVFSHSWGVLEFCDKESDPLIFGEAASGFQALRCKPEPGPVFSQIARTTEPGRSR